MAPPLYVVNVEGVIAREGRYLMITRGAGESHAPGALSLPGGKVDAGALGDGILEETLRREIREEVGLEVEAAMCYLESKAFVADDGEPVIDIVFLCRYRAGTPTIADPDEIADMAWMSAAEIAAHPRCFPWTRQSIALAEQRARHPTSPHCPQPPSDP